MHCFQTHVSKHSVIPNAEKLNISLGQPNWTDEGCLTKIGAQVTCECSHLTFFAVLMVSASNIEDSKADHT